MALEIKDITTIRTSKEVAHALRKIAILADKSSIHDWLEDKLLESYEYDELKRLAPNLAARKKALTRKPRKLSM